MSSLEVDKYSGLFWQELYVKLKRLLMRVIRVYGCSNRKSQSKREYSWFDEGEFMGRRPGDEPLTLTKCHSCELTRIFDRSYRKKRRELCNDSAFQETWWVYSGLNFWGVRGSTLVLFLFYMNVSGMYLWRYRLPGFSSSSSCLSPLFHHGWLPPISLRGIGRLS